MADYDFEQIETRWQRRWREARTFEVVEDPARTKYYVLEMLPYPSGRHPRRARAQLLHHRRDRALQAYARLQRPASDRLGRAGPSRRERGHPARRPSGDLDAREHREHEDAAPAAGLQLSVEPRDRELRPGVLPLEPVVLPAHAGARHRLSRARPRSTGARPARRCSPTSRPREASAGAATAAVEERELDQWFLRITAYQDELLDDMEELTAWPERVLRAAAQLDRALAGRRARLPGRRRRAAARVHDAHRHRLRRDVHGAGARAPARGGPAGERRGRAPTSRGCAARTGARARRGRSRRKASSRAATRATRSAASASRSGSAISC